MTHEAVLYIRWSWVQIMSFCAEKRPPFHLHSLCRTPGSQPGLVTHGRGDAVPCCPSYTAWPSLLGLFQLRRPFAFTMQCEPDVGHLTLREAPCLTLSADHRLTGGSGGGGLASLPWPSACLTLTAGPYCISPFPKVIGSWKGHWTNIQSPYVLDDLSRNFWDPGLHHASCPFHSRHLRKKKKR